MDNKTHPRCGTIRVAIGDAVRDVPRMHLFMLAIDIFDAADAWDEGAVDMARSNMGHPDALRGNDDGFTSAEIARDTRDSIASIGTAMMHALGDAGDHRRCDPAACTWNKAVGIPYDVQ